MGASVIMPQAGSVTQKDEESFLNISLSARNSIFQRQVIYVYVLSSPHAPRYLRVLYLCRDSLTLFLVGCWQQSRVTLSCF